MLPRPNRRRQQHRRRVTGAASAASTHQWPAAPQHLACWLKANGSLTARLRAHGRVTVVVQSQGTQRLWPAERVALGAQSGHVREVILQLDGIPVVWARSATTHQALAGAWKALKGLGSRALAELLFSHAKVEREAMQAHNWRACGPERQRAHHQWERLLLAQTPLQSAPHAKAPRFARASVFRHRGHALRVMEAFSPWLGQLGTPVSALH